MNSSILGKTIGFWDQKDISRLMNNIIYGKIMKEKINVKKYNTYKNGFLG